MQVKRGNIIVPIEKLLSLDPSKLEEFVKASWECLEAIVTDPSPVVLGYNDKRFSIVIGMGSLIMNEDCGEAVEGLLADHKRYRLVKNEWVDVCKLGDEAYFAVSEGYSFSRSMVENVRLVSLTQKMVYPRVFNGWRIEKSYPLAADPGDEWIIADEHLESPIALFTEDNKIIVSTGSEELGLIKTLLRVESYCSKYRLIVS
ncbi:MAG: hypothetical protein LRS47_03820 [Desulfurococcales archaeon]|nr:hypothetical protein [Desulfurococcales archaeon]